MVERGVRSTYVNRTKSAAFSDGLNGVGVRSEGKGRRNSRFLALGNIVVKCRGSRFKEDEE